MMDGCTAFVQLFKLSSHTETNDQSQGSINLQRLARPIGVTMVLSGLLILAMGESCDAAVATFS